MIMNLFGLSKKRVLKDGEQEEISVSSDTYQVARPAWLFDTCRLALALSKGDRATALAAFEECERGATVQLISVEGSVTQEIWARLTHLGYSQQLPAGTPVRSGKVSATILGTHKQWINPLLAAKVDRFTEAKLTKVSKGLAKHQASIETFHSDLLERMRNSLFLADSPFAVSRMRRGLFSVMQIMKLIQNKENNWCATQLGALILPYFFDHINFEKRDRLRELSV